MYPNEMKTTRARRWSILNSLFVLLLAGVCVAVPPSNQIFEDYWAREIIRMDPQVAHFFIERSIDGKVSPRDALINAYSYQSLDWSRRAIESYSDAITPPYVDPASDWASFWIGDIIHDSGQDEYLREVFTIRSPPWGRFWLGVWNFIVGEYDSSATMLRPLANGVRGQAIMRLMAGYFEAMSYSRMGQSDRAESVFENLLIKYPRNLLQGEINYRMGSIDFAKGEWASCRERLTAALEFYDMSSRKSAHWWADDALFLLGAVDFMENRHLVAMRQFERLRQRFPDSPYVDRLPYLALLGEIETKATRADQDSVLIANLDPDLKADVLMRIAYLFMQDGELGAAQANFEQAAEVAVDRPLKGECYLFAGECAYGRRRYRDALSFYQLAYESSAERGREAGWGIAWCHIRNRRYDDARIYLSGVFSGHEDDFAERARLIYAETFLNEGRPGRAAQELQDFLKTCRGQVCDNALYDLILCYDMMSDTTRVINRSWEFLGKYSRHRRAEDVIIRLNGMLFGSGKYTDVVRLADDIELYSVSRETADRVRISAERAKLKLGIYDDPLLITETFLQKYPDSPLVGELMMEIGNSLCEAKDYERGAITFDRLRARDIPDSIWVEASYYMARCYLEMGDTTAAGEIFSQLIGEWANFTLSAHGVIVFGDFFFEQGNIDRAIEAYSDVVEKAGDSTQVHLAEYRLGLAYEQLGRFQEARILFNNLRNDPSAKQFLRKDSFLGLIRVYFEMAEYERGFELAKNVYDTIGVGEYRCALGEQIGKLAVRLGDVDEAMRMLIPMPDDSVSCAGSEDISTLYDLSLALEFRERIPDAKMVWHWMIETSDNDSIVALARDKIEKYEGTP